MMENTLWYELGITIRCETALIRHCSEERNIIITKKVADLVVSIADRFVLDRFAELLGKVDRNSHGGNIFVSLHMQDLRTRNNDFYALLLSYRVLLLSIIIGGHL